MERESLFKVHQSVFVVSKLVIGDTTVVVSVRVVWVQCKCGGVVSDGTRIVGELVKGEGTIEVCLEMIRVVGEGGSILLNGEREVALLTVLEPSSMTLVCSGGTRGSGGG
jgi:hypothetical protein